MVDKIEEGNSSIEVIDLGSNGKVKFTIDGNTVATLNGNTLNLNGDLFGTSDSKYPLALCREDEHSVVTNRVYSDSPGHGASFECVRLRGESGAGTAVQDGDRLGIFNSMAYDGSVWVWPASLVFKVDGTVSSNTIPTKAVIETTEDSTSNRAERLVVRAAGTVEPGTDDSQNLGSSSKRWKNIYATNGTIQTSDARLKEDIRPCNLGLDFISKLDPKVFANAGSNDVTHQGLIAQNVKEAFEELDMDPEEQGMLVRDEETGNYGLRYDELIAPLVKAIQEISISIDEAKEKVKTLEK